MSGTEPSLDLSKSQAYASARFAADLPPLTIEQTRQVEDYLARYPGETFWSPLARRALMESFVRSRINPVDGRSLIDAIERGDVAPVLPIDNRTPYFPAPRPWTSKCTAVIRERAALTVRVLGNRALVLTERMALHVGDFADYMQNKGITDYFDEVGSVAIDGALAGFVEMLSTREVGALTHAIIRREYGEFRPISIAQADEFRGGSPAFDRPGISDLMNVRRAAHARFDDEFRRLGANLPELLEKELRQLYPWEAARR
jgi:hypothetical protein